MTTNRTHRRWAAGAAALILPLGLLAMSGTADAGTTSSLTLNSSSTLSPSNPRLGQTVSFTAVLAKSAKNPVLILDCFQNQSLVWEQRGAPSDSYLLGGTSSQWQSNGGSATCVANVYDLVTKGGTVYYMVQAVTQFVADGA